MTIHLISDMKSLYHFRQNSMNGYKKNVFIYSFNCLLLDSTNYICCTLVKLCCNVFISPKMNLYFRIHFSIENEKCASFIEWTFIAECFEYDSSYGKYTALLKKKRKKTYSYSIMDILKIYCNK